MNTYFVLFAICFAFVHCEDLIENEDIEKLGPQVKMPTNDDMAAKITNLLKEFKDKGFNNYTFDNVELPIDSQELGISANIKATGALTGLLDCDVKVTGFAVTRYINLKWTNPIEVNIEPYDMEGFVHMIKVFGKGKLSLVLNDVAIDLVIVASIWPNDKNAIFIKKFQINKVQFTHKFELTGWLNDEVRSKMISKFVNDNLHSIIEVYDKQIKTTINTFITEKVKTIKIPF